MSSNKTVLQAVRAETSSSPPMTVVDRIEIPQTENELPKRDWRFWMIFVALSVTGLLSAVEATVISNALPTIVHDIELGENYVWVVNVYLLTWYAKLMDGLAN